MHNLILKRFQSIRRARREVAGVTFCARTFQKPAHYFCYCPTGPSRRAGREAPPRGCLLHGETLVRLYDCVLACRVVSREHVPLYAIVAVHVVATSGRGCVASVVAVTAAPWASHPPCRAVAVAVVSAVFSSPSCGCDTPTNASVCNGFGVVCVDLICTTYVGRV